jgi:hypothetical protein
MNGQSKKHAIALLRPAHGAQDASVGLDNTMGQPRDPASPAPEIDPRREEPVQSEPIALPTRTAPKKNFGASADMICLSTITPSVLVQ